GGRAPRGARGAGRAPGAGGGGEVRGDHAPPGGGAVEGRGLDPPVAVAAERARLQATGRHDEDFHTPAILRGPGPGYQRDRRVRRLTLGRGAASPSLTVFRDRSRKVRGQRSPIRGL